LIKQSIEYSGIVAILFCGISLSRYGSINLNKRAFKLVKNLASTISEIFESVAFLIIGVAAFGLSYRLQSIGFAALGYNFIILLVARFINISVISLIINLSRMKQIPSSFKTVMWFSGLRGAMGKLISLCNCHREL
jgi:NhaP-type Na+/H+ or K+/H+ antiporter